MQHCPNYLMHEDNYEKHAPRVSQVIAAVAQGLVQARTLARCSRKSENESDTDRVFDSFEIFKKEQVEFMKRILLMVIKLLGHVPAWFWRICLLQRIQRNNGTA